MLGRGGSLLSSFKTRTVEEGPSQRISHFSKNFICGKKKKKVTPDLYRRKKKKKGGGRGIFRQSPLHYVARFEKGKGSTR